MFDYSILQPILEQLLLAGITGLVGTAIAWLLRKVGTQKMVKIQEEFHTKSTIADAAVRFVEQKFSELDGPGKFEKASSWLSTQVSHLGLSVSPNEIEGLIEFSVKNLKDEAVKVWGTQLSSQESTVVPAPVEQAASITPAQS